MIDLILRRARLGDAQPLADIAIKDGTIHAVGQNLDLPCHESVDLAGAVLIPGLVDVHHHIDTALSYAEVGGADGFDEAVVRMQAFRKQFSEERIYQRGERMLNTLLQHGVCAVRSHCIVDGAIGTRGVEVLLALKKAFADRIALQVVANADVYQIPPEEPAGYALLRSALALGCEVVGGAPHMVPDPQRHVDAVLRLAHEFNCLVDMHVDESNGNTLPYIATATVREKLQGRVTCGHCSGLSRLPDAEADRVIAQVREAELHIVCCPLTNLYLQGGDGRVAGHRGLTRVRELMDQGVNLVFGSDNVQDAFNPYGNGDPMLTAMVAGVAARLGSAEHVRMLLRGVTQGAATVMQLSNYGIEPGCRADLVALDCNRLSDVVPCVAGRRLVVMRGRILHPEAGAVWASS